jgi:hypothetical protein
MDGQVCVTPGCSQPASLRCPTCIKQEINGSFFCSQVICVCELGGLCLMVYLFSVSRTALKATGRCIEVFTRSKVSFFYSVCLAGINYACGV